MFQIIWKRTKSFFFENKQNPLISQASGGGKPKMGLEFGETLLGKNT
jgi:hypothetical protein